MNDTISNNQIYKEHTIKQWERNPIGSRITKYLIGTREFFDEERYYRYNIECPWFLKTFSFEKYGGKKVLEIGVGTGTDHLELAKAGAILTGIDITPKSIELTKKNLEIHGYHSNLLVADAENLPFEDDSFDAVYSFGVLHHTPDTRKAINEIYRVLKPQGRAIIALYHKNSLFYWYSIFLNQMILKGRIFRSSRETILSEIECGGRETKPLVKLYTKKDARNLFQKFNNIKLYTRHIGIGTSRKILNRLARTYIVKRILGLLSLHFGWYLIIEAEK